jgi:hypothetical protein
MFPQQAHADENFCPECQAAWDEQPLGALVRRWTAEAADGNGRQSGLVCVICEVESALWGCYPALTLAQTCGANRAS